MKLLFDENLSRKLPAAIADLYPDSIHVSAADLLTVPDKVIWEYAREHDFAIVTTDSDFYELALTQGPPPKVIWLRSWSHPTKDAEALLRREAIRITQFVQDPDTALLVLGR